MKRTREQQDSLNAKARERRKAIRIAKGLLPYEKLNKPKYPKPKKPTKIIPLTEEQRIQYFNYKIILKTLDIQKLPVKEWEKAIIDKISMFLKVKSYKDSVNHNSNIKTKKTIKDNIDSGVTEEYFWND